MNLLFIPFIPIFKVKCDLMVPETFELLIEIPKGDGRRIHINYNREYFVDLGPIKEVIPVNDGIMPIAYGFVIGTLGKEEGEKDELDALLYSKKAFKVGDKAIAFPIAMLNLENNDHKIVFADESTSVKSWDELPTADRDVILAYFGYKSRIKRIGGRDAALGLIHECITDKPFSIPKVVKIIKEKAKEKL